MSSPTKPFLALITPVDVPPGITTPPDAHPEHPIVIPPDPGSPGFPTHPIIIPPDSLGPGVPTHPIVIPPPPVP